MVVFDPMPMLPALEPVVMVAVVALALVAVTVALAVMVPMLVAPAVVELVGLPVELAALVKLSAPGSQSQVDQVPCTQVRVPTQPLSPVHWATSSPLHLAAEVDDVDEQLPHSQGRERTNRTGNLRCTMVGVCPQN